MLPIYNAFLVEEIDLPGGTTKPLLVSVDTGNKLDKYVVKVFTHDPVQNYSPLAHEIYANLLALQFDIQTPEMALISFSDSFNKTLVDSVKTRALHNPVQ